MTQARKFLGVTVMPEFLQNEGVERVLDNLVRAGVDAVTTSPYVMAPADERTGGREPPDDAGAGNVRLLDRPLWGRRELFVRTAPSFTPDLRLYRGLKYQPSAPTELTKSEGHVIQDLIRSAQARHLKVYLQVQAAIPPGYRVQFGGPSEDDRPRLPDGRIPPRRLANNGSLASPHIRDYTNALLRDLCRAYPEVNGVRVDWPEYAPYFLDDVFLDFGEHARAAATRLGFDFEKMRSVALELYQFLHGQLRDEYLQPWLEADGNLHGLIRGLTHHRGLVDWLAFKATLVDELLSSFRETLTDVAGKRLELVPNAFAPPFTLASGFDFARAGKHSMAISTKLYTMHWPMILKFYGDALLAANPKLSEPLLVKTLVRLLDIGDDTEHPRLADYTYPEPNVRHPVGSAAQARKLRQAQTEAGETPVYALVHGYGVPEDFRRRLSAAWEAGSHGVWINRYAYLSDEKLAIIREVCR
jgi:hypothetical protein